MSEQQFIIITNLSFSTKRKSNALTKEKLNHKDPSDFQKFKLCLDSNDSKYQNQRDRKIFNALAKKRRKKFETECENQFNEILNKWKTLNNKKNDSTLSFFMFISKVK
ncbi:hypothetical protein HDU92_006699, partial [Lobulomyces angularis]